MPAQTAVFHLQGEHDQQSHAGGARRGGDRTGYPEVDAVIEDFLDEPLGDWTTSDKKVGDMEAVDCAGACDSVAEQFTEYATERGLKVYTTRTSVDEMGYEITGDPAGEILDVDGNIVAGFYQEHTVNQVYVDGQAWPLTIDFTARQYGYDTPVKTDPAVRDEDLAVEVFHLQGQHDQKAHGRRGAGSPIEDLVGGSDGRSPKHQGYFGEITFGRYHGTEDTGVYSVTVQEHGDSSSWENDQYDVAITTDEDGNMTAAEVTRRVTRNDIGNPEMAADDLNTLFDEHGIILEWGEAVVDGRRVQTTDEAAEIAREEALEETRAVAYDTLYSAYNFDVTDRSGEPFFVESDPTVDNPSGGTVQGRITNYDGETIGTFEREIDLEFGRVDNGSFSIDPAWQGRGIGTAFLDRSEAALADAGIERSRLQAVDVGRYAWMARGYQVSPTDRASVVREWVPQVESILAARPDAFTDVQRSQARAVTRSWQAGDDVYGSDLLSVSDEFRDVFLDGPTYSASRELKPAPRDRAWVDPNQLQFDLAVEVFRYDPNQPRDETGKWTATGGGSPDPWVFTPGTVHQDDYGTLEIRSTGVDRIRQAVYDYEGGSDVFDIVIIENDDGTVSVDVENLYGADGTVEGEAALEAYLNEGGIDDVAWDGERGTLHASHRGAIDADPVMAEFTGRVEGTYSGGFKTASGDEFTIGETRIAYHEATDQNAASAEVFGVIQDDTGNDIGTFSRSVYADGVVYNHSLNIDPSFQGQGIGTAFLDQTEPGLGAKEIRMAAVNVGKYAWAARGYRLDPRGSREVAAAARDQWLFEAKQVLSDAPEWRAGDFTTIDKLGALERRWMADLNDVYPGDLLAIDPSLKSVLLNGPSWEAVRELDGGLTAAAGIEVFHLQGQHDQSTHGNRGGGGVPDEFAQAPSGYRESAQVEWAAGAAYLAENEMPEWWAGLDYIGDDGLPVGRNEVGANYDTEDVIEKTEQFREEVGDEVSAGIWMIGRAADARRKEVIAEAISTNQISPEDAKERWGYDADADRGEWQELPQTLYHATSAMGAIAADGSLKTRREIGGRDSAAGLGGGTDNTISFTSDRAIADGIARSLHEAHRALNLPKDTFLTELRERSGSYWADVEEADRSLNGTRSWDTLEERFDLYRSFARVRERQEGILDPLFFNVNPETLRDMNPDDIGIVEVMPAVTGAKGYQVSALGEWRTPTGAATEITRFIETDPVDQFGMRIVRLGRTEFHLDGQHDQQRHGRRGPDITDVDMILDAFEASGVPLPLSSDPDLPDWLADETAGTASWSVDGTDVGTNMTDVYGTIYVDLYGNGEMKRAGSFSRSLYSDGEVYNDRLNIDPSFQGRGVGTAFLDYSERQLANAGFDKVNVDAVAVGKYAWAARGYRVAEFNVEGVADDWIALARVQASEFDIPVERVDAIAAAWKTDPAAVYGSDIIALDPDKNWSAVFLEGESWTGERSIVHLRDRQDLAVEAFHLQGQHDQQTHAGGRGGEVLTPPTVEEFDEAYDTVDPIPVYERMGIDQTIMRAADFSEGTHDASWAHAAYTLGGSEAMNKYLRGQELPAHFQDEHATDAATLKQAIAESEPTKHDITVYRGLSRFSLSQHMGERWQDDGFISTSLDRRVAESFGDVVEIRLPAGSKAIAGNWGEFEVILAPGTQFDVMEDGLDVVQ